MLADLVEVEWMFEFYRVNALYLSSLLNAYNLINLINTYDLINLLNTLKKWFYFKHLRFNKFIKCFKK